MNYRPSLPLRLVGLALVLCAPAFADNDWLIPVNVRLNSSWQDWRVGVPGPLVHRSFRNGDLINLTLNRDTGSRVARNEILCIHPALDAYQTNELVVVDLNTTNILARTAYFIIDPNNQAYVNPWPSPSQIDFISPIIFEWNGKILWGDGQIAGWSRFQNGGSKNVYQLESQLSGHLYTIDKGLYQIWLILKGTIRANGQPMHIPSTAAANR